MLDIILGFIALDKIDDLDKKVTSQKKKIKQLTEEQERKELERLKKKYE